jgi:GPI mannosyltransferase 3
MDNNNGSLREYVALYWAIAALRLCLTHFCMHSYFDPDEFWQTMEPAYCAVFTDRPFACQGRTWEWMLREPLGTITPPSVSSSLSAQLSALLHHSILALGPARTYLNVFPTILFYHALRILHWDTHFWVSRGPLFLQVLLVAVPIDVLTYSLARSVYPKDRSVPRYGLFATLTSWFHAYTTARTLANAYETLLFLMALQLVAPELFATTPSTRPTSSMVRAAVAFVLGGASVAMRNTALLSFVPLGGLLALRRGVATPAPGVYRRRWIVIQYLLYPCAVCGALGFLWSVLVDRLYFGYWSFPVLANLYFNVVLNHASLYGAHPLYWYWLSAVPTISGLLLPFLLYAGLADLLRFWRRQDGALTNQSRSTLWILLLLYVGLLSGNRHKEFRYLLPILPLICLLTAPHLAGAFSRTSRWRVALWIGANLATLAYLGMFHQSGPVAVNSEIVARVTRSVPAAPVVSIHYLTGACHSTPLQSHLHSPAGVHFDTWHLDCSPQCRVAAAVHPETEEEEGCETHQFVRNPIQFVQRYYCLASPDQAPSCRTPPDYLVTRSEYMTREMMDLLTQPPFSLRIQPQRFPFHLRGVRLSLGGERAYQLGAGWSDLPEGEEAMYGYQTIVPGLLDVNWHAVLLLVRAP